MSSGRDRLAYLLEDAPWKRKALFELECIYVKTKGLHGEAQALENHATLMKILEDTPTKSGMRLTVRSGGRRPKQRCMTWKKVWEEVMKDEGM